MRRAQLFGGLDDGAAAEHRGARREGAEAIGRHRGIVVDASDIVERDAELVAGHLTHRRHDALALGRQRRGDGENARRLQAQRHRVAPGLQQRARADRRAGAESGQFRVAGDTDAAQFAVCAGVVLLGAQPLILRLGGGELQAGQVVDVVVHQIIGVAVGHRLDRDQVALPQLHGVELQAGGNFVQQQFERRRRGRAANGTVGTDRRLVGGDAAGPIAHRRDLIGTRHQSGGLQRLHARRPQIGRIGADIDAHVGAQRQDVAVAVALPPPLR